MITAFLLQQPPQNPRFDVMTEICSRPPNAKATLEGAERLQPFYVQRCATQYDLQQEDEGRCGGLVTRLFSAILNLVPKTRGLWDELSQDG